MRSVLLLATNSLTVFTPTEGWHTSICEKLPMMDTFTRSALGSKSRFL